MRNKTLANELITRCAGIPSPFRGLIIEAAHRLLQMVPEDETKVREIAEANSLRWLANMWPLVENPKDEADKMSTTIHLYCTAAADRIEQMAETIDYARTINAENVRLKAELEKIRRDSMVDIREVVKLQEGYTKLVKTQQLSKKNICELVIPFRDRYGLTDLQALRIARKEMDLAEIIKTLEGEEYPTCLKHLDPIEFERRLMGRWNLPKEGENHET